MRRAICAAVLVLALSSTARAHDAYDDTQGNPLRWAAYVLHPVGWTLEWLVARPLHFLVSQPALEPLSGHGPHEPAFGVYPAYLPDRDR